MTVDAGGTVALIFLLATAVAAADEPKSVVTVRPLESQENPRLEQLALTVQNTLLLTLQMLGRYRVVPPDAIDWERVTSVAEASERNAIDNIITGSIAQNDDGVVIELSVFNRLEGDFVLSEKGLAESIFDFFTVTDELTIRLLEGFTREHIAFGELLLTNHGEDRDYTVMVDSRKAGVNLTRLPQVLEGDHRISIVEELGSMNRVILRRDFRVIENETTTIDFAVPLIYPEEAFELNMLDREIATGWHDALAAFRIYAAFDSAQAHLQALPGGRDLSLLTAKYDRRRSDYENLAPSAGTVTPEAVIEIDGDLTDWQDIQPLVTDETRGTRVGPAGTDITQGFLARDEKYLYMRMDFADGGLVRKKEMIYELVI